MWSPGCAACAKPSAPATPEPSTPMRQAFLLLRLGRRPGFCPTCHLNPNAIRRASLWAFPRPRKTPAERCKPKPTLRASPNRILPLFCRNLPALFCRFPNGIRAPSRRPLFIRFGPRGRDGRARPAPCRYPYHYSFELRARPGRRSDACGDVRGRNLYPNAVQRYRGRARLTRAHENPAARCGRPVRADDRPSSFRFDARNGANKQPCDGAHFAVPDTTRERRRRQTN